MDENALEQLAGWQTATTILLQQLYSDYLRRLDPSGGFAGAMARQQMDMVDESEPKSSAGMDKAKMLRVRLHALHHLEQFWAPILDEYPE